MPKDLTDMQRVILARAASRDNRRVFPTPSSLDKNAGAIALSLKATIASGLIDEVLAEPGDYEWRTDLSGAPITLVVNDAGFAAIGVSTTEGAEARPISANPVPAPSHGVGSKLALIIERLRQPCGATIEELVEATSWQKHSVRGAISGALKTKRKLNVTAEVVAGTGRVYRIPNGTALGPDTTGSSHVPGIDQP